MSGLISIGSAAEWQSLLSGTNVVVADFYADWCGPCKMIAPHFERLAKEHSQPKKVAFAKVNVDAQSEVARSNGVSAMPTFKIFHGGNCIDTIKGANPSALSAAVSKAVQLAGGGGGKPGAVFKTPGRTLGSDAPVAGGRGWYLNTRYILNTLTMFVGLYLVSLFSFDARKAAQSSWFNIDNCDPRRRMGSGPGHTLAKPARKPAFTTLADLGTE